MTPQREMTVRLACFAGVLVVVVLAEWLFPRRRLTLGRRRRWPTNFGLVALNSVAVRLLLPITAVAAADFTESAGAGLFALFAWPRWVKVIVGVIVLDLAIYLQHVLFHAVPALWRLHRLHHADRDFDVTTGVRFHTVEILLSAGLKLGVIVALAPPPLAVLMFEILLNATSMFNHGNLAIPRWIDRFLRWIVVTPDMHRVHHSTIRDEADSNYGFNLPWWDFLLGTYRDQPAAGHESMTIGVAPRRNATA
jgi:sterol desaturase/sphingolipid hydroxylase (fatty acid hydroxylase superfamily)